MWAVFLAVVLGSGSADEWKCPDVGNKVTCSCYAAQTVICTAEDVHSLVSIAKALQELPDHRSVSLLDCTLRKLAILPSAIFQGLLLHGLVISSGELVGMEAGAFTGLEEVLETLGLPNNGLSEIPGTALAPLKALLRLDLSHNRLQALYGHSFTGVPKLRFLDLSGNQITSVDPSTFTELTELEELHLQENNVTAETVAKLQGLSNLEELDLSNNSISGPLSPLMLPRLKRLKRLNLAHNQISSVLKGALKGFASLKTLSLDHNTIDVLEDDSFNGLTGVNNLNLAHNRIVAISEASLAHLSELLKLDISYNFLRALTPDLISPLNSLRELALDNNDISIVSNDALTSATHIRHLRMADNPLNCDCSLAEFAKWLRNSKIADEDKRTPVCATPPHLENGLVQELRLTEFVCDHHRRTPINNDKYYASGTHIELQRINYDGKNISLLWSIDTNKSYTCNALFLYEELGSHQVLLESDQLHCNSTALKQPRALPLILTAPHLQTGHRYKYCLRLVEKNPSNESSPVLGCSKVLPLTKQESTQVLSLHVDFSQPETLSITADIWPQNLTSWHECTIKYQIHISSSLIMQKQSNCSFPNIKIESIKEPGPYNICAVIFESPPFCILTQMNDKEISFTHPSMSLLFLCITITLLVVITLPVYHWLKKIFHPPKIHEQCFIPCSQNEQKHSRYVKLQATTKL